MNWRNPNPFPFYQEEVLQNIHIDVTEDDDKKNKKKEEKMRANKLSNIFFWERLWDSLLKLWHGEPLREC